jgi:hypothetical protein
MSKLNNEIRELSIDDLDTVSGGGLTVVAEKGYVGVEIKVGGYGVAVWATGGSVCGSVSTPTSKHGGSCTPT